MELRVLRHFATVASTLNFREAAERLHMTQPALTRSIASLERELGVLLFVRDKRHVELTPDGARLLERAQRLLADADDLKFAAHSLRAAYRRKLRVGIYGNGLAELTHPVLESFCDRYPETALEVRDADFARGIDPLLSGEFDVALLRSPVDLPILSTVHLFREPLDALVWRDDPRARQDSVDICELFAEPWVTLPPSIPGEWGASWLYLDERGGSPASIGAYARSESEFLSAVAYRRLVGLLPASVHRLLPHPGVAAIPTVTPKYLTTAIAYSASDPSPEAEAFTELAAAVVKRNLHLVPRADVAV